MLCLSYSRAGPQILQKGSWELGFGTLDRPLLCKPSWQGAGWRSAPVWGSIWLALKLSGSDRPWLCLLHPLSICGGLPRNLVPSLPPPGLWHLSTAILPLAASRTQLGMLELICYPGSGKIKAGLFFSVRLAWTTYPGLHISK